MLGKRLWSKNQERNQLFNKMLLDNADKTDNTLRITIVNCNKGQGNCEEKTHIRYLFRSVFSQTISKHQFGP